MQDHFIAIRFPLPVSAECWGRSQWLSVLPVVVDLARRP